MKPDGPLETFLLGILLVVGSPFYLVKSIIAFFKTGELEDVLNASVTLVVGLILIIPAIIAGFLAVIFVPIVWIVGGLTE